MAAYDRRGIHKRLLEAIWDGLYLEKTLNVNEVIEDLVGYLSIEEAKQIYIFCRTGYPRAESVEA